MREFIRPCTRTWLARFARELHPFGVEPNSLSYEARGRSPPAGASGTRETLNAGEGCLSGVLVSKRWVCACVGMSAVAKMSDSWKCRRLSVLVGGCRSSTDIVMGDFGKFTPELLL